MKGRIPETGKQSFPEAKQKNVQNGYENQFLNQSRKAQKHTQSGLRDWGLLESQHSRSTKPQSQQNLKLLQKQCYSKFSQSIGAKVDQRFGLVDYQSNSVSDLNVQLKGMRDMMQQLNKHLNNKLTKYELVDMTPKNVVISNQPEKEIQLLLSQIQINTKILEAQQRQIEQLRKKDRSLSQRDYLIEFQERANAIMKEIYKQKKQKHLQGVVLEKKNGKILSIYNPADPQLQYKDIKVIKHQILYYFKKFHQNQQKSEELEQNYRQIQEKDHQLTRRYSELTKAAGEKNLLVSSNHTLMQMKKKTDELVNKVQWEKRKLQIIKRSVRINQDKIDHELDQMQKVIVNFERKADQVEQKSGQIVKQTERLAEKYSISALTWKNFSDKFPPIRNQTNPPQSYPQSEKSSDKNFLKPHFKRNRNQKSLTSIQKQSWQEKKFRNKYKTIDQSIQLKKIDDKNHEVGNKNSLEKLQKNDFRINMKPSMKIRKVHGITYTSQTIEISASKKDESDVEKVKQPSKLKKYLGKLGKKKEQNIGAISNKKLQP